MASIASEKVEILVHTTAPSRGHDDVRYRTLARAYMNFEPATRRQLTEDSASNATEDAGEQAQSQLQDGLRQSTPEERESAASYHPETEENAGTGRRTSTQSESLELSSHARSLQSPMVSFNSVFDNINSPIFRGLLTRDEQSSARSRQTQDSSGSWKPSPSVVIADSQPEGDMPVAAFSSPSRILELYLPRRDAPEEHSPQLGEREDVAPETSRGISASRELLSSSSETSRMPSSPSPDKRSRKVTNATPENRSYAAPTTQGADINLKRKWPESTSGEEPTISAPARSETDSAIHPDDNVLTLPTSPRKRRRTEESNAENIAVTSSIPSSQIIKTIRSSPPSFERPSPWSKFLEIRPPPPPTSTADLVPEMLITDTLHQLASKMPAARLFRPVSQARDLRAMERGYWLLNCESWDEGLRRRCWHFLGDRIGKNLVGWGVWCMRDAEHSTIRVYCWGIVVDYIYLLLYLASEGKVKKIGASWIGGDGEPIIRMPS